MWGILTRNTARKHSEESNKYGRIKKQKKNQQEENSQLLRNLFEYHEIQNKNPICRHHYDGLLLQN